MKNQDPQEEIARLRKALANEKKKNRTVTKQRDKAKADLKEAKAAVKKKLLLEQGLKVLKEVLQDIDSQNWSFAFAACYMLASTADFVRSEKSCLSSTRSLKATLVKSRLTPLLRTGSRNVDWIWTRKPARCSVQRTMPWSSMRV